MKYLEIDPASPSLLKENETESGSIDQFIDKLEFQLDYTRASHLVSTAQQEEPTNLIINFIYNPLFPRKCRALIDKDYGLYEPALFNTNALLHSAFPMLRGIRGPVVIFFQKFVGTEKEFKEVEQRKEYRNSVENLIDIPHWFIKLSDQSTLSIKPLGICFHVFSSKLSEEFDKNGFQSDVTVDILNRQLYSSSNNNNNEIRWEHRALDEEEFIGYCSDCCFYPFDKMLDFGKRSTDKEKNRMDRFIMNKFIEQKREQTENGGHQHGDKKNFYYLGQYFGHFFIPPNEIEEFEKKYVATVMEHRPSFWNESFKESPAVQLVLDVDHLPPYVRFVKRDRTLIDGRKYALKRSIKPKESSDTSKEESGFSEEEWGCLNNREYFMDQTGTDCDILQRHDVEMGEIYVMDIIQQYVVGLLVYANLIKKEQATCIVCESYNTKKESKYHVRYPSLLLTHDSLRIVIDLILHYLAFFFPTVSWTNIIDMGPYKTNGLRMIFSDKFDGDADPPRAMNRQTRPIGFFDYQNRMLPNFNGLSNDVASIVTLCRIHYKEISPDSILTPVQLRYFQRKFMMARANNQITAGYETLYPKTYKRLGRLSETLDLLSKNREEEYYSNQWLYTIGENGNRIAGELVNTIVNETIRFTKENYLETNWKHQKFNGQSCIHVFFKEDKARKRKKADDNKNKEDYSGSNNNNGNNTGSKMKAIMIKDDEDSKPPSQSSILKYVFPCFYYHQGEQNSISPSQKIVCITIATNCKFCQTLCNREQNDPELFKARNSLEKKNRMLGFHSKNVLFLSVTEKNIMFVCRSKNKDTCYDEINGTARNWIGDTPRRLKTLIFEELQHRIAIGKV